LNANPPPADGAGGGAEDRERIARRLLALTHEMLTLGRQGDWVLFSQREEERQQLSRDLFATPVPREAAAVVADCVRRVLDIDQQLIALADEHREEAAKALKDLQKGRTAASAYKRFSR
jgi:hypothetical protein